MPIKIKSRMLRSLCTAALACVALLCGNAAIAASNPQRTVLIVEQGMHKLMRSNADVTRVAIGDPKTADVSVVNRRDLLLDGKAIGITSLIVWVKGSSTPRQYLVRVQLPKDPLKNNVPDPELAGAIVDPGRGVEGKLPNLLAHRRATLAAAAQKEGAISDRSSIELESQVLTDVKIAEVSRTTAQQYGLGLGYSRATKHGNLQFNSPTTSSTVLENAFNLVFDHTFDNGKQAINGTLNLLESKGLARVLAEPSLLATSGQTASYLAGGEFPVPVSQGGSSNGSITVQYKEFGVRLSLTPTVLSRDRIALKVAPEVSDLDFSAGITVGGVSVPALKVRRTDTTIELGDGETFVISGLVSSNLTDSIDKLPWLGDIPVLGAFFKSTALDRTDKELIMVVTPHLVRPISKGAALPKLPGDQFNNKTPNPAYNIFLESGKFDSGFSR